MRENRGTLESMLDLTGPTTVFELCSGRHEKPLEDFKQDKGDLIYILGSSLLAVLWGVRAGKEAG